MIKLQYTKHGFLHKPYSLFMQNLLLKGYNTKRKN